MNCISNEIQNVGYALTRIKFFTFNTYTPYFKEIINFQKRRISETAVILKYLQESQQLLNLCRTKGVQKPAIRLFILAQQGHPSDISREQNQLPVN